MALFTNSCLSTSPINSTSPTKSAFTSAVVASLDTSKQAAAHRAEPTTQPSTQPETCTQTLRNRRRGSSLPTDGIDTIAIRGGREIDPTSGAILTPICQSTTYVQDAVGQHKGHTYSRSSNPTVSALEAALGALEAAPDAVCFGTGMAAITTLFLSLLRAGDHVVLSSVLYGGTVRFVDQVLKPLGIGALIVDASDPRNVDAAINERTRLVFIETPANPTLILTDVEAIAQITRARGVLLAVDNTFLTPVILRPLDLGADISVYSTTKYIEGHNATVGGSLVTRDETLLSRFRLIRKTVGSIQAPFEAWLTLRGLKTLPLRIRHHSQSALVVAKFLEAHPLVARVAYPGLESFPQHTLAKKLHAHADPDNIAYHGGIIAFELKGGADAGRTLMNSVRLCSLAENLGAAETLITHPVTMTHADVSKAQREATGITDGLVRLSVGLENVRDIIADLAQALDQTLDQTFDQTRTQTLESKPASSTSKARTRTPKSSARPQSISKIPVPAT